MRRLLAQTPAPAPGPRRAAAALAGLAVATLASGCMVFNPVQTDVPYEPADGVSADVGSLAVRDLLLVSGPSGAAVLSGGAINLGTEPITVQVAPQAAGGKGGARIELGPREQANLATMGLSLDGIEAKPGAMVPLSITTQQSGTTVVDVPVLAPTGPYSTIAPTATPTASSSETSSATPTETATSSSTPTPTTSATTTG